MHSQQILPESRFDQLKKNLLKEIQDESFRNKISQIDTIHEIWIEFFSNFSSNPIFLKVFDRLIEADIFPTKNEMDQLRSSDNTSAWFWLVRNDECIAVINRLFAEGIWPAPEILNQFRKTDNSSFWFYAAVVDKGIEVIEKLFAKDIWPSHEVLNQLCKIDNSSFWFWMAGRDEGESIIEKLFAREIWPIPQVLNQLQTDDNSNFWFWIACKESVAIIEKLFAKNIWPSPTALNQCSKESNTSFWFWQVAMRIGREPIFEKLFAKGIWPTPEVLNQLPNREKVGFWFWIAGRLQSLPVIEKLFARDILPELSIFTSVKKCFEKPDFHNIVTRMKNLELFVSQYHADENNMIVKLLTREDKINFYGFLYLFYLMTAKTRPEIVLPLEIWLIIGKNLLPFLSNIEKIQDPANRESFAKCHTLKSIDHYLEIQNATGIPEFIDPHTNNERVKSLKKQILIEPNPQKTLWKQYWMSKYPGKTCYKNSNEEYQHPFSTNVGLEFETILNDNCFLNKRGKN